jgi:uncharacterized protein
MEEKQQQLFSILRGMGQVIVAYSGGTDSAYLAWAASRTLGEKSVAITADSLPFPNPTSAMRSTSPGSSASATS